uniref:Uncharacterized protein n=1 Tax=Laurencia australis TaxID=3073067 RepID=A0AA51RBL9_9FLOR|nr:hypothetical protein [Laurencia australis]WMP12005.1 hypothetical protein [Laurencia australis]
MECAHNIYNLYMLHIFLYIFIFNFIDFYFILFVIYR